MFDLSYLTESPPSRLSATSPGVVPLGTKPDQPNPDARSGIPAEPTLVGESRRSGLPATKPDAPKPTPIIEKLPCGCRINTTARTIHVPCDAHKRCPFCRGVDLVFNSKPEQVKCPHCGTTQVRATRKLPLNKQGKDPRS